MAKLNSFDEWSPLREVVVGTARGYTHHVQDLTFELFYYDNLTQDNPNRPFGFYPKIDQRTAPSASSVAIKTRYVDELVEDVEGMADLLASLGIVVHRPQDLAASTHQVTTPPWDAASVLPALNVRDNTLILGDSIVETPPMLRARYFESQFLKPHFLRYFAEGAGWDVMPRPWMTDRSFDLSYTEKGGGNTEDVDPRRSSPYDVGMEMMLDAAQCLRFGRDIVVNVATKNHSMAVDWLERRYAGAFRFHRINRLTDSHIDSSIMPLRPGVLLLRSEAVVNHLPRPLKKWKHIIAPEPDDTSFPTYEDDDLVLTSPFIDMNVLSLDENTVLVNEAGTALNRVLESHGFDIVPVRHRHRRIFGGGLHCFTLDTVRDAGIEDYF